MAVTTGMDGERRPMEAGVILPQRLVATDPGALVAFAQGVEALGYGHLLMYDHVLGADAGSRPDWTAPYTVDDPFHEALVTSAFLAAATSRLEFTTGVLVLPQRQTALVAKQVAEVAVLSRNRFRLGVGLGWNRVEFESLGVRWERRAARYAEQLTVLRELWTRRVVSYAGEFHTVDRAGICPLPGRLPLWLGSGGAEPALRRVAAMADGWIPSMRTAQEASASLDELARLLAEHGRSRADVGVQARMILHELPRDSWRQEYDAWAHTGATHLALGIHGLGVTDVDQALRLLADVRAELLV